MHAAVQVVVNVGYTEEAYQVVFAIIDERDYFVAARRGKTTVDLLHRMALQKGDDFSGLSEVGGGGGAVSGRSVVEIAHDAEAVGRISYHFLMQFSHILVATYKNGRTGVASLCTVFLEDVSEGQPVDCEADEEYTVEVDEEAGRG